MVRWSGMSSMNKVNSRTSSYASNVERGCGWARNKLELAQNYYVRQNQARVGRRPDLWMRLQYCNAAKCCNAAMLHLLDVQHKKGDKGQS